MSEDRVLDALRALRDADAVERFAGPELEARLVQAFRRRKRRVWKWAAVGIAAGLAALVGVVKQPEQTTLTLAPPAPPPPSIVAAAPSKPQPVRPKPVPQPREVVTEFYPLMDVPPPFERGELVRMTFPASALRNAGFEVETPGPDDPIVADVLVGQEGLARAIRFVNYQ